MEICEELINHFDWATHYQKYLILQKKGLRKAAFEELEKFVVDFKKQNRQIRWRFIDFVNKLSKETSEYSLYMPFSLHNNVFKAELNDWINYEPDNPLPYKWSSDFSLLARSIQLDPFDQESLDMFFTRLINIIRINQHEIDAGFGYSGNPKGDLDLINDSLKYLHNIKDSEKAKKNYQSLQELKQIALEAISK